MMNATSDSLVRCVCPECKYSGELKAEQAFAPSVEVVLAQCNYAEARTRTGAPQRITFETLRRFAYCRACARMLSDGTLKGFAPFMRIVRTIELLQQPVKPVPVKMKKHKSP